MAAKKRRSLAEIIAREFSVHQKDCVHYRKRTETALAEMAHRQDRMHIENAEARTAGFDKLSAEIASIKAAAAEEESNRAWWWNRAREATIAALFLGLVGACWYIITHIGPAAP